MNTSKKNIVKEEKGFTGVDLSISIIVIIISISIIATFMYNLYLSGSGIKRNVIATDYAINILETIESADYDAVTFNQDEDTTLKETINALLNTAGTCDKTTNTYITTISGYTIEIKIEKYSDRFKTEEEKKEDYIKLITVKITYNLGKNNSGTNTETLEISTLKTIK